MEKKHIDKQSIEKQNLDLQNTRKQRVAKQADDKQQANRQSFGLQNIEQQPRKRDPRQNNTLKKQQVTQRGAWNEKRRIQFLGRSPLRRQGFRRIARQWICRFSGNDKVEIFRRMTKSAYFE